MLDKKSFQSEYNISDDKMVEIDRAMKIFKGQKIIIKNYSWQNYYLTNGRTKVKMSSKTLNNYGDNL